MRGLLCFVGRGPRGPCKLVILCKSSLNVSRVNEISRDFMTSQVPQFSMRSRRAAVAAVVQERAAAAARAAAAGTVVLVGSQIEKEKIFMIHIDSSIIERQGNGFRLIDPVFYFCVSEV